MIVLGDDTLFCQIESGMEVHFGAIVGKFARLSLLQTAVVLVTLGGRIV